ncbi:Helix-turn-helix domain-containing protein OS=Lysinibacillus sphaericus OX=1421 GN=LS41612_21020 PE=4 SV=1 [Lysinibacillus sphaericus]
MQAEKKKEYMNEYQVMLFDFMNSLPLADNLKDELHKVVLAAQVQSAPDFIKAKNVLLKIAMDIKEGTLTVASTLRAVFVGAYNKAVSLFLSLYSFINNKND